MAICMGLAVLLWLLTKLSNEYDGQIAARLEYINLPANLVPTRPLPDKLVLTVQATGFRLLGKNIFGGVENVVLDYALYEDKGYVTDRDYRLDVERALANTFIVKDVDPDTLFFDFEDKMMVKVPVVLNGHFSFAPQYDLMEEVIFEPDSVTISGPESILDSVFSWPTSELIFENLQESKQGEVGMMSPEGFAVDIEPKAITYTIPVEEYTELSTEVEVVQLNVPDSLDIIIYPKTVNITFRVGISNYKVVGADDFEANVDFAGMDLYENQFVNVVLTRFPPYIKNVTISPQQVEYIIYKQ